MSCCYCCGCRCTYVFEGVCNWPSGLEAAVEAAVVLGDRGLGLVDGEGLAVRADGLGAGVGLVVRLSGGGVRGVQAPLGLQRLLNLLGVAELEVAGLLGDDGALVLRLELGDKLGLEPAGLLGVEVTHLLGDIKERHDSLVVALLGTLLGDTAGAANLNGELLTLCVTNKLAGLLLDVLGLARGLVDGPALLGSLAVADLLQGLVALLHGLVESLLLEGDLAGLLEILLTHFLLGSLKLRHIGVVALLNILVGALKDGILGEGGDGLLLLDTAEAGLGIGLAAREVNSSLDSSVLLPALPAGLASEGLNAAAAAEADGGKVVGGLGKGGGGRGDEGVVVVDAAEAVLLAAPLAAGTQPVGAGDGQSDQEHHENLKESGK